MEGYHGLRPHQEITNREKEIKKYVLAISYKIKSMLFLSQVKLESI